VRSASATPTGSPRRHRCLLHLLGIPTFALSLSVTTVAALVPVLLEPLSGPAVTGLVIGVEGVFAVALAPLVGRWSDRVSSPLGGRLPFLLVAAVVGAASLAALPFVDRLVLVAAFVAIFYVAYYTYFTPYWALYPDLVPPEERARSQGVMGLWRGLGLAMALVGGALLSALWTPLPFAVAAFALLAVTGAFVATVRSRGRQRAERPADRAGGEEPRSVARDAELRRLLVANALWETALSALRAFVLVFLTVGLGRSAAFASAVLAAVAVGTLVAAPAAAWLAARLGELRVVRVATLVYGAGLVLPGITQSPAVLAIVPVVAFAAASVTTLSYALLMGRLGGAEHGSGAGAFGLSRGIGLTAGPVLAGVAITLLRPALPETDGYAAIFLVAAAVVLLSLGPLARLRPVVR
jgi:maltose/moltooligosaccharide transporter